MGVVPGKDACSLDDSFFCCERVVRDIKKCEGTLLGDDRYLAFTVVPRHT